MQIVHHISSAKKGNDLGKIFKDIQDEMEIKEKNFLSWKNFSRNHLP